MNHSSSIPFIKQRSNGLFLRLSSHYSWWARKILRIWRLKRLALEKHPKFNNLKNSRTVPHFVWPIQISRNLERQLSVKPEESKSLQKTRWVRFWECLKEVIYKLSSSKKSSYIFIWWNCLIQSQNISLIAGQYVATFSQGNKITPGLRKSMKDENMKDNFWESWE